MSTAYCPSGRTYFTVDVNPPYGVIHKAGPVEKDPATGTSAKTNPARHLHAITREPLVAIQTNLDEKDGSA